TAQASTQNTSQITSPTALPHSNARLLLNHDIVSNTYLWFQHGRIIHPQAPAPRLSPRSVRAPAQPRQLADLAAKTATLAPKREEERAVRIITIAPELKGLLDVVPELVRRVAVSIGELVKGSEERGMENAYHSEVKISEAEAAVASGATCITHLFNAMQAVSSSPFLILLPSPILPTLTSLSLPQFHHRDPGIVGLLGSTHLPIPLRHSRLQRYGGYGFPAETYSLGGRKVTVDEGLRAYLEGTTTLAGR
ncbi:hypothetical protein BC936DRAFT_141875, partial [Jimgerdemannia flammicorona]